MAATRVVNSSDLTSRLSANDLRHCLRLTVGATLGFVISKLMNWNYGVFYTVYPLLLLGLVPILNAHILRQFVAHIGFSAVYIVFIHGIFGNKPGPMLVLVVLTYVLLFYCMSRGPLFLFGALSVVSLSIQLHFASYPYPVTDMGDLLMSNTVAAGLTLVIALLMHSVFPDLTPRQPRPAINKPRSNIRHEVILSTCVASLSFVVFQVLNLHGSLSAQVASVLVLFPLNWHGAGRAGWNRAIGTLVGCNVGLCIQFILLTHFDVLLFVSIGLWLSLMLFARHHMLEGVQSGAGFGAMTTMAILFGQYLTPEQDLVYNALYRFSSVALSVTVTLCAVYLMHQLLNRFAMTKYIL